jgi:hypothetical protein
MNRTTVRRLAKLETVQRRDDGLAHVFLCTSEEDFLEQRAAKIAAGKAKESDRFEMIELVAVEPE